MRVMNDIILIRTDNRAQRIKKITHDTLVDIVKFVAEHKYVVAYLKNDPKPWFVHRLIDGKDKGSIARAISLQALSVLPSFVLIRRGVLLNAAYIVEYSRLLSARHPWQYECRLSNGECVSISRRYYYTFYKSHLAVNVSKAA